MKMDLQGGASVLANHFVRDKFSARADARPTKFILLFVATMVLFFSFGALAETTNVLSDAEIQGRNLARQLCDAQPETNFTQTGVLQIRNSNGTTTNYPIKFTIIVTPTNWQNIYQIMVPVGAANATALMQVKIFINHNRNQSNSYRFEICTGNFSSTNNHTVFAGKFLERELLHPFARSDFWYCDLGLEFLHWPEQKILPKTTNLKRGRDYTLLESTNPDPSTNGYSRVLSYIDKETGGILEAEAYDSHGRLLKEFYPKDFKKVDGQWQLQSMEMDNVQTGSRSWIKFDVKKQ